MDNETHRIRIKEYLAEMAGLADDLTDANMRRMYSIKVELNHVMCCYYRENLLLPPIKVQSSTFRANPDKYCRMSDERMIIVHSDEDENGLRMSFGGLNPLDSPMDAELCEICLSEA